MKKVSKSVLNQALELSALERATLVEQLLQSLDKPDENMDALWAAEAEARIDAYEKGVIEVVAVSEVLAKYAKS